MHFEYAFNYIIIITFVLTDFLVLVLQTMMVWLWGINLWTFSQSNVNYAKMFEFDQNHLTHREIWKVKQKIRIMIFLTIQNLQKAMIYFSLLWSAIYTLCPLTLFLNLLLHYVILTKFLLQCATWMTIVVPTSMTAYLYLYSHGEVSLAASQPV